MRPTSIRWSQRAWQNEANRAKRARSHALYADVFDWLNQVDRGFDLITEQAIRRGSYKSVRQLDSCKANGVRVYRYLTDLFKTFSQARSVGGYEISLP